MPPYGIHTVIGLAASSQIKAENYTKTKLLTLAILFGSFIPDIDTIAGVIAYLLGSGLEVSKIIHRSWSHSLITIGIIALCAFVLLKQSDNQRALLGFFLLGACSGMLLHTIADVVYLGYYSSIDTQTIGYNPGIALLWPLLPDRWALFPLQVNDWFYSFLIASDFLTDSLLIFFPVLYLAYRHNTDQSRRKPLLIVAIIDCAIFSVLTLSTFFIAYTPEDIVFYSYLPGMFDVLLVIAFPFLMHETLGNWYWYVRRKSPPALENNN